jgi:peptidoglycan/LPS O-acetylase OafA/YrhL
MPSRIVYLDGLRGVLAVIVFLHHFFYAFYPEVIFGGDYQSFSNTGTFTGLKLIGLSPINILFNPGFAIHFFFLLSGYVQTYQFYQTGDKSIIQRGLLKRYFRLALPTLSVVILVYCAHKFHWIRKDLIAENPLNSGWVKSVMPNTLQFHQLFKEGLISSFQHNSRYYQVLWTMPTELANSYLVLLLALALHKIKHQTKVIVVLLLIEFSVLEEYYSIAFVSGMLIARLRVEPPAYNSVFAKKWLKWTCLAIGLYFGSYPFTGYQGAVSQSVYSPISFFDTYPHIISYYIGSVFMFLFILQSPSLQAAFSVRLVLFYGKISFMFYLIHFLLLFTLTPVVFHISNNIPITIIVSLALVTGISWLLTVLVDQPTLRFCNRFSKLFFI